MGKVTHVKFIMHAEIVFFWDFMKEGGAGWWQIQGPEFQFKQLIDFQVPHVKILLLEL